MFTTGSFSSWHCTEGFAELLRNDPENRATLAGLRGVARAVECHADETGSVPDLEDVPVERLVEVLRSACPAAFPLTDAWGGELRYSSDEDGDGYAITSEGRDPDATDDDFVLESRLRRPPW